MDDEFKDSLERKKGNGRRRERVSTEGRGKEGRIGEKKAERG